MSNIAVLHLVISLIISSTLSRPYNPLSYLYPSHSGTVRQQQQDPLHPQYLPHQGHILQTLTSQEQQQEPQVPSHVQQHHHQEPQVPSHVHVQQHQEPQGQGHVHVQQEQHKPPSLEQQHQQKQATQPVPTQTTKDNGPLLVDIVHQTTVGDKVLKQEQPAHGHVHADQQQPPHSLVLPSKVDHEIPSDVDFVVEGQEFLTEFMKITESWQHFLGVLDKSNQKMSEMLQHQAEEINSYKQLAHEALVRIKATREKHSREKVKLVTKLVTLTRHKHTIVLPPASDSEGPTVLERASAEVSGLINMLSKPAEK